MQSTVVAKRVPNPERVEYLNIKSKLLTFNPFKVGKQRAALPVDCIYGYSYSILSGL